MKNVKVVKGKFEDGGKEYNGYIYTDESTGRSVSAVKIKDEKKHEYAISLETITNSESVEVETLGAKFAKDGLLGLFNVIALTLAESDNLEYEIISKGNQDPYMNIKVKM